VAKTIATIGGVAVAPGMSLNRRVYTKPMIAAMVAGAQERISGDGLPLTMLTHHSAEDDSTRIAGRVRALSLDGDGAARFIADIADTEAGRTIAALVDSTGGDPFLETVSIRAWWEGRVRKVTGPDGKPAETADGITLNGLDFTKDPGVTRARIDTFAWAAGGKDETFERVLITESVQEARVTVSEASGPEAAQEGAPALPESVREALRPILLPGQPHVFENGECVTCRK
jgi:hypothetical protein